MERNQENQKDWMGRHAHDPAQQWKLNASADHFRKDGKGEEEKGDWGDVDPLTEHDLLASDDNKPSEPGAAV